MLAISFLILYYIDIMTDKNDMMLIKKFILKCARSRMTLEEMGGTVGRTKGWASMIANGKIARLQFGTRNRILEYLGEL